INARYLGETVEVLFEEKVRGRWKGRTSTNKLVFVESKESLRGQLLPVNITWTGPWSMQGRLPHASTAPISLQTTSLIPDN
ncbi:MAG TPA: TRAM domain-containing protein, partial [Anaerolineales bacterium]|nr:TRAM domain-containing protein [Anaerolineales bacterium]